MRINKKSWHYRLIKWSRLVIPKSLCPYFWTMNWCVVTAIPRAFFRRAFESVESVIERADDRNEEIYKGMSDMQAFRMLVGQYHIDDLTTGNYSSYGLPRPVSIWWMEQEAHDRRPVNIIMEMATSYKQGKIVFRSLSVKRKVMQVLVSYFWYWYVTCPGCGELTKLYQYEAGQGTDFTTEA